MKNKLVNSLLVLVTAVIAPLALVYATTYGATSAPENRAGPYIDLGLKHIEQNRWSLALEDFNQAIKIAPKYPEAFLNRGYINIQLDRYENAVQDSTRAIQLGTASPEIAYTNRGLSHFLQGDYNQGALDLNKALEINPDHANAHFLQGLMYTDFGENELAIDELERALSLGLDQEARQIAETVLASLKEE